MSPPSNLTSEQDALLMQLLRQKFPAQFPPQQQAGTVTLRRSNATFMRVKSHGNKENICLMTTVIVNCIVRIKRVMKMETTARELRCRLRKLANSSAKKHGVAKMTELFHGQSTS